MSAGHVVVVGDALLDVDLRGVSRRECPDAPAPVLEETRAWYRPGGAALAARCARQGGHEVVLVTAVGEDRAANDLAALLGEGVHLVGLPLRERTPTKTRLQANGRTVARLDEGCVGVEREASAEAVAHALAGARAVLVADYGYGLTRQRAVRRVLAAGADRAPLVWDPHPRGADPVPGALLVTPNAAEAGVAGAAGEQVLRRAGDLTGVWGVHSVAVTLGARGAAWSDGSGGRALLPGTPVRAPADTCGAGDAFAAACTTALAEGRRVDDAVRLGVRSASSFVARGAASAHATPRCDGSGPRAAAALGLSAVERAPAERVVATGGCFDVLHAGHVDLLRRARALGGRLVVLLNGDASVRAIKGSGRPVVGERDRARVLSALDCVDEVVIFGEDTPVRALEELRPDVWVKGGDYEAEDLPETSVVRRGGGEVVIVPLVPGHSTTDLITRIRGRGHEGVAVK